MQFCNQIFFDTFTYKEKNDDSCDFLPYFFLTHGHKDHIKAIPVSFKYTIHCSIVTCKILKLSRPELKTKLVQINEIVPIRVFNSHVYVYVLNANHLIGSIMFLMELNNYYCKNAPPFFKKQDQRILFTGDYKLPTRKIDIPKCDILFFDNTFHVPGFRMNTQEESLVLLKQWIDEMLLHHKKCYIVVPHIGTMDLLYHLNLRAGYRFRVSIKCMRRYDLKLIHTLWTALCDNKSQIILVSLMDNKQHRHRPILLPSARWFFLSLKHNQKRTQVIEDQNGLYRLNFSQHSDYYENQQLMQSTGSRINIPLFSTKHSHKHLMEK